MTTQDFHCLSSKLPSLASGEHTTPGGEKKRIQSVASSLTGALSLDSRSLDQNKKPSSFSGLILVLRFRWSDIERQSVRGHVRLALETNWQSKEPILGRFFFFFSSQPFPVLLNLFWQLNGQASEMVITLFRLLPGGFGWTGRKSLLDPAIRVFTS